MQFRKHPGTYGSSNYLWKKSNIGSRSLDSFLIGSHKVPAGKSVFWKKDEEVGERYERSVHHMPKSVASVDFTVCGVCLLELPVSPSVAGHGFLPGVRKFMPSIR